MIKNNNVTGNERREETRSVICLLLINSLSDVNGAKLLLTDYDRNFNTKINGLISF